MSHKKHLLLLTEAQIMFFFLKAQAKQAASVRFCLFIYIDVYLKLEPYLHILFPPIPQPLEKYRKEKKKLLSHPIKSDYTTFTSDESYNTWW